MNIRSGDVTQEMMVLGRLGFKDVEQIGEGGYGRVYQAFDPKTERQLVAKCPQNPNDPRWSKEVNHHRSLSKIAGVPKFLGSYEFGKWSFLFVEHVDGKTLMHRYAADASAKFKHAVPPMHAARIVCNVAKIVHSFHAEEYVHRDLSPNNIMVNDSGGTWVIDFGLSLLAGDRIVTKSKEPGLGTESFRSPEQGRPRSDGWELDNRTDVFSLGRVLQWLLSDIEKSSELAYPDGLDGTLIEICRKATAEQREDRFPDAKTLADALREWMNVYSAVPIADPNLDYVALLRERYLEPWRDRLNRCFRSEDADGEARILHVYHDLGHRPTVKYDLVDSEEDSIDDCNRPSTKEEKEWYLKNCESLPINDPHAVIVGEPDWNLGTVWSRIALYKEIKFWRHRTRDRRTEWPRVLSANPLLFCEEDSVVLLHVRSKESATFGGRFEKFLHTFGGGFMPEFGKRSARDDGRDLLLTATRECMEESGLAPSFRRDTPAVMCREIPTNFYQLMVFAKSCGRWECSNRKVVDKWEGDVRPIPFDRLEEVLIDPQKTEGAQWVPTGRLHVLAWLALGAPLLRPSKKLFNGKTPWEVYQSVTSAILKEQESAASK